MSTAELAPQPRFKLPPAFGGGIIAVVSAFLVGAALIAAVGVNPLTAYAALFEAAVGTKNGLAETLVRTVPLGLCGLGIALAFRAGVFNVGAEGQLFLGGTAAAAVGVACAGWPSFILLPAMAIAAMLAGGLWSGLAAWLKLRFRADELITTIMLNYVAIHFVGFLLHGPLKEPNGALAQTARLTSDARLPVLLAGTRLHAGILIVLVAVVLAHLFLWKRVNGFRLRVVGLNPRAAENAGINIRAMMLFGFLVCGALSGLAGFAEVAGVQRRMIENLSPGFGYTAIIVALLGSTNPVGVLAAAFLFAALQIGATTMESAAGVPGTLTTVIQGLVVLFLIGRPALSLLRERLAGRRT
ncbi:ABC transporter permease [Mesorhizobium sp. BAC0120]|uniref:ABC transporter permease n=1 Tax=Mesorhizobium sp. BAC0120 TaxID=3090670 RepID=UPI00298C9300|nr:ABC transporter permease [Mesorhizobium sp. BAC0120]MDW6021531.1 ABC transporter permease [Mesorhizobium sp. BAC0120]